MNSNSNQASTSHTKAILAYMQQGHALTSLDALRLFGCLRLAARIADIKALGYPVHTRKIKVGGKTVAQYSLFSGE
ncbi:helix-turn-helix domain-containing protein [Vitreoscilla sp. C1]|uniref:helix-turn-helix domain-containing protein n=1 Tax=Vitreoscilla sp. (strain C1) TaxID=96942 RepID=UPI000CF482FA|nr:helix-turn-helix domain-containing protein [Vitreoscilla sp. C1]